MCMFCLRCEQRAVASGFPQVCLLCCAKFCGAEAVSRRSHARSEDFVDGIPSCNIFKVKSWLLVILLIRVLSRRALNDSLIMKIYSFIFKKSNQSSLCIQRFLKSAFIFNRLVLFVLCSFLQGHLLQQVQICELFTTKL